jgi:NADPH:quinone reductase-like Zn-dependent oxidoreductase
MSGLFGYSHMTGGYAGGQAEYVRVSPFSDVGPIVIPDGVEDEKVLFLSDILPTGWMAAENAQIEPGDTVAVWGCGPVGLFAVQSAFLMGAERVIAIDHFPHRLELAKRFGAETINFEETETYEALMLMTGGIGPDAVIDAVGLEAHGFFVDNVIDQIKKSTFLGTDRTHSIRQAIHRLPQGRARLDAGRLWRVRRQVPARRLHGEGADAQDRPDACPALHARAAQCDHGGQDRYDLPDQPHAAARAGARRATRCSTTTRTK